MSKNAYEKLLEMGIKVSGVPENHQNSQQSDENTPTDALTHQLELMISNDLQPENTKLHKQTMQNLSRVMNKVFSFPEKSEHGFRIHQFGSVASGLWLRGSADLDVCLELVDDSILKWAFEKRKSLHKKCFQQYVESVEEWKKNQHADAEDAQPPKYKSPPTIPQLILELVANQLKKLAFEIGHESATRYVSGSDGGEDCIKLLTNTRIPIIKLHDYSTGISIDVGYGNSLGVLNSRWLGTLARVPGGGGVIFGKLVRLVKHWARRRAINDTYYGTLSSYAYSLMVVYYLSCVVEPPVLPNLQQIFLSNRDNAKTTVRIPDYDSLGLDEQTLKDHYQFALDHQQNSADADSSSTRNNSTESSSPSATDKPLGLQVCFPAEPLPDLEFDCYFFDDLDCLAKVWPDGLLEAAGVSSLDNSQHSLGELLFGFFKFWAHDFDYKLHCASCRLGGVVDKQYKRWVPELVKQQQQQQNIDNDNERNTDQPSSNNNEPSSAKKSSDTSSSAQESSNTNQQPPADPRYRYQRYWFCLEDPFEISHNLGRPVGRDSLYFIRGELLRAVSALGKIMQPKQHSSMIINQQQQQQQQYQARKIVREHLFAETEYKTREEHKQRNKQNLEWSEKRRQQRQQRQQQQQPEKIRIG